jgi:hypothetical protein
LLHQQDYSLQSNRKTEEGQEHPDRDAQFRHINHRVKQALATGQPVISVDTKKKELIGNYANEGQQWLPAKQPKPVQGHDFPGPVAASGKFTHYVLARKQVGNRRQVFIRGRRRFCEPEQINSGVPAREEVKGAIILHDVRIADVLIGEISEIAIPERGITRATNRYQGKQCNRGGPYHCV